jgi:hypothetical protein
MITKSGKGCEAGGPLSPQAAAVEEIQRAIARGYRRVVVLGPKGSKRLASVRAALKPLNIKLDVIDLEGVRTMHDLDGAARRAGLGRDFQDATAHLERRARRHRVAFAFHNFGECSGLRDDDRVVFAVWLGAKYHCRSSVMVFTTTNPEFMSQCFERFKECRTFVYRVELPGKCGSHASGRGPNEGESK